MEQPKKEVRMYSEVEYWKVADMLSKFLDAYPNHSIEKLEYDVIVGTHHSYTNPIFHNVLVILKPNQV